MKNRKIFWWIMGTIVLPVPVAWLTNLAYDKYYEVRREPTFIVDPLVTTIVNKSLIQNQPLTIVDKTGNKILDDVNIATFYFFNGGKEPIEREDILKPLKINFSRANKVLDLRILKVSSNYCSIKIADYDTVSFNWELDFKILEKNDGFTAQVIYVGSQDHKLTIGGKIKGADEINTHYRSNFLLFYFLSLFLLAFTLWFLLTNSRFKKFNSRFHKRYLLIVISEEFKNEYSRITFTYGKVVLISVVLFNLIFISSLFIERLLARKWERDGDPFKKVELPISILPDK